MSDDQGLSYPKDQKVLSFYSVEDIQVAVARTPVLQPTGRSRIQSPVGRNLYRGASREHRKELEKQRRAVECRATLTAGNQVLKQLPKLRLWKCKTKIAARPNFRPENSIQRQNSKGTTTFRKGNLPTFPVLVLQKQDRNPSGGGCALTSLIEH